MVKHRDIVVPQTRIGPHGGDHTNIILAAHLGSDEGLCYFTCGWPRHIETSADFSSQSSPLAGARSVLFLRFVQASITEEYIRSTTLLVCSTKHAIIHAIVATSYKAVLKRPVTQYRNGFTRQRRTMTPLQQSKLSKREFGSSSREKLT